MDEARKDWGLSIYYKKKAHNQILETLNGEIRGWGGGKCDAPGLCRDLVHNPEIPSNITLERSRVGIGPSSWHLEMDLGS
ncbi:unnamed protein product [Dovyalis caffra]|uniref:Transposase n=1 Tax=Dovyalis caffra TaxID=77055 RepID=A0AAV1RZ87_9ROSI|nr:unnamed protein product [Dovyalis caffra]